MLGPGGNPAMDEHPFQRGVKILLVASCYRNRDKLWNNGPLDLYADFTLYSFFPYSNLVPSVCMTIYHSKLVN